MSAATLSLTGRVWHTPHNFGHRVKDRKGRGSRESRVVTTLHLRGDAHHSGVKAVAGVLPATPADTSAATSASSGTSWPVPRQETLH